MLESQKHKSSLDKHNPLSQSCPLTTVTILTPTFYCNHTYSLLPTVTILTVDSFLRDGEHGRKTTVSVVLDPVLAFISLHVGSTLSKAETECFWPQIASLDIKLSQGLAKTTK